MGKYTDCVCDHTCACTYKWLGVNLHFRTYTTVYYAWHFVTEGMASVSVIFVPKGSRRPVILAQCKARTQLQVHRGALRLRCKKARSQNLLNTIHQPGSSMQKLLHHSSLNGLLLPLLNKEVTFASPTFVDCCLNRIKHWLYVTLCCVCKFSEEVMYAWSNQCMTIWGIPV